MMMSDDFVDNKAKELFAERWVESGRIGQRTQAGDLYRLAVGVGGSEANLGFVFAYTLGDFEAFSKQVNERSIDVVDACSAFSEHIVVVHSLDRSSRYRYFDECCS